MNNLTVIYRVIFGGLLTVFMIGCTKNSPEVPTIKLNSVTDITATSVSSGGEIIDIGSSAVLDCGLCWGTNPKPAIENNKKSCFPSANNFYAVISDLQPKMTYYIRAYATNSAGTGYSSQSSFSTLHIPFSWTPKKSMDYPGRYDAVGFVINGKAYLGLGQIPNGNKVYDFWEYDPLTDNWSKKPDYPGTGSYLASAFSINGKGYVCLGLGNSGDYASDLWEYSPGTNTWQRKADFPGTARYGAGSFVIGDTAFVGTGSYGNGSDYLIDLWMYVQSANTWTRKADFPGGKRSTTVCFSIGKYGYMGTGLSNSTTPMADFWKYDKTLNSWFQIGNFPGLARWGVTSMVIDNKAYVGAGRNYSIHFNDFYEYNPESNSWGNQIAVINDVIPRANPVSFTINGIGYMTTGYTQSGTLLSDLWTFEP